MGLFVLASIGLSMYIWSMTLYNVYKPLSSTLSAAAPSVHPLSLFAAFQSAFTTTKEQNNQPPKRQGRKRKQLTLAEAQREELRESLKILFIWLACKGTEPAFDYTFGYVVPFYNAIKVLCLLVFARFRAQLSIHLFDSFIIPLGRPNTPLINSTAFTNLILPWLRFMLSLPFAHLFAAFRNTLNSLLSSWGNEGQVENATLAEEERAKMQRQMLEADRVPPPKMKSGARQASTSGIRKDGRNGSGPSHGTKGGGGGGLSAANNSLRYQRSMDSLASRTTAITNRNLASASRQRSVSSRMTPGTQETFQQLQSLPSVPRDLPDSSIRVEGRTVSGPASHNPPLTSSPMSNFAHIPGIGNPMQHNDFVPPPNGRPISHLRPSIVEKMPGSLANSPVKPFSNLGQETLDENVAGDQTITMNAVNLAEDIVLSEEVQQEKQLPSDSESTSTAASKKKAPSKRKVSEIDGELSEGREAKLKISPGKKVSRVAPQNKRDASTTTAAPKTAKAAATKKAGESATTTSLPRSRSKRNVGTTTDASGEEAKGTSRIPRTRRGAT
ncbi:uncharacterized protein FA14DRAFT_172228 [Meira miltonrushii]|uniref:Uncharacterized protein n=1 Tax=Meira miltonrushii TaxID=1280837 RepID=A0A316VJD8_9BASI|nr:uncharacterized protein FA14DRAFT_172228 [Meira miltonrushii]PWN35615.1 hypothetical protein FA14DRAFT_172228 [Meira miltonrushii]